jgi:hypothetical protein
VIQSYRDFYNTAAKDPYQGNYTNVEEEFNAPTVGNSRYAHNVMVDRILAASGHNLPMPVLMLCRDQTNPQDTGVFQVLHRASRYPQTVIGAAQPWDGNAYAIAGDLIGQQYAIVPFDNDPFALLPAGTHVLDDAEMSNVFNAAPDQPLIDPVNPGDANSVEIRTRPCTYLPFRYVNLFLGENITPRLAFERIYAALTADNKIQECRPLLDYIKLAATRQGPNQPSQVARGWPALPRPANAALIAFFDAKVNFDLPSRQGIPTPPTAVQGVVQGLGDLVQEQRQTRIEAQLRQARADAGKTPTQYFGDHGVVKLIRLCHVAAAADLPPLYTDYAQATKTSQLSVLQNAIDEARNRLQVPFPVTVTVALNTKFAKLQFAATDVDDFSQGIGPFQFGLSTPAEETQIQQQIDLFQAIHGGQGTPSLADTMVLESPDDAKLPYDIQSTEVQLESFRVVLDPMLGSNHPVVQYLSREKVALRTNMRELIQRMREGQTYLPIYLMRYYQVEINDFMRCQGEADTILTFSPRNVISETAKGATYWHYTVPSRYLTVAAPRQPAPAPEPAPAPAPGGHETPASQSPGESTQVLNRKYDDRFNVIRQRNIPTRVVKRRMQNEGIPWPLDDANRQRCLGYNVIGRCNTTCNNSHDHRKNHTEPEQARLLTWATEHWWASADGQPRE